MALQMNVSGIRRNLKNIAHNYTDAQIKVREATSNDPWGPSSTLMSEVADLTYNVVAFTEIMQMIWKRLNDHGRNWRHVYKALVLLEYLIKTGSEKVADQCKENIFAIETLKDFQYIEENKDQGMNVREKARALVTLLKDEERLRNERVRALKAKERFAQSVSGIGSDSRQDRHQAEELTIMCDGDKDISSPTSPTYHDTYVTSTNRPSERNSFGIKDGPSGLEPQLEAARPQTVGEEELQLQLALAMSKEEAEQEEQKKRSDDVRLQMAITQSEEDFKDDENPGSFNQDLIRECRRTQTEDESAMNDLLDINFNPHSGINGGGARPASTPPTSTSASALDPWGMPATASNTASAASASPLHTAPVKSLPGVDFSSSPPPVPPLPSFPMTFSDDAKVTLRHSNPPLLNSSPLLYATHRHNRSGTPSPNPFHDSPSLPRPTSLLITSSSSSTTSASVTPYRHSLFPPSSSSYASMLETPLSTRISTSSTFSTSSYTTTLLGKSCSDPPANVWGLAQTDPWGMALPNGGSETPNQVLCTLWDNSISLSMVAIIRHFRCSQLLLLKVKEGSLGFMVQKKDQTTTRVIKLLLEMPTTPTKGLSNLCFFRFMVQKKDQTTTRVIKLLLEMPTTPTKGLSNTCFFRFMVQKKDQTTTRVIKLLLEMPTTPTKALSNMCFFRFMVQKKDQTTTRVIKLLLEIPTTPTKGLSNTCFFRFMVQKKDQTTTRVIKLL
ncbi:epsin-2-like isoform X14 [Eriocheir sinensis]|uniref:epsin-2-like isoform X14 n=1 Tax=Eriocheir sinensis TaxID=95602 RepID=UPI0021C8B15B|nr:epsin-2-like isoform X14 [Eriocheir sinensis]